MANDEEVAEPPKGWNPTPSQPNGSTPASDRPIDVYYADGSACRRTRSAYCNWSLDLGHKSLIGWRYSDPCCGSPVSCDNSACNVRQEHVAQHRGDNLYRPLQPATDPQPAPRPTAAPAAWSLVMRDMADRDVFGATKYGVRLQPGNGRDALKDAYQEALDLAVYLRTAIYERDGT
jgi:hypothetical protein